MKKLEFRSLMTLKTLTLTTLVRPTGEPPGFEPCPAAKVAVK
jgi:hypothetical protein